MNGCGSCATNSMAGGARKKSDVPTKAELYEHAKDLDIKGRSKMSKDELVISITMWMDEHSPIVKKSKQAALRKAQKAAKAVIDGPKPKSPKSPKAAKKPQSAKAPKKTKAPKA